LGILGVTKAVSARSQNEQIGATRKDKTRKHSKKVPPKIEYIVDGQNRRIGKKVDSALVRGGGSHFLMLDFHQLASLSFARCAFSSSKTIFSISLPAFSENPEHPMDLSWDAFSDGLCAARGFCICVHRR
jgi:hypothetical protein